MKHYKLAAHKEEGVGFSRVERLFIVMGFDFSVDESNLQRRNVKPIMVEIPVPSFSSISNFFM